MGACAKKDRGLKAKADPKVESQQDTDTRKAMNMADHVGSFIKNAPNSGVTLASAVGKDVDVVLTESYVGKFLMLARPNKGNFGQIVVDDDDAKAIYDALRVKVENGPANDVFLSQKVKRGQQIICYLATRKDAPNVPSYSCMINIDYVTGAVNFPHGITLDPQVPALAEKHVGNNVFLNPAAIPPASSVANRDARPSATDFSAVAASPRPLATIYFGGSTENGNPDAKALYYALGVPATAYSGANGQPGVSEVAMVKTGHNISCKRSIPLGTSDFKFMCKVMFNYQTGRMLEQITGAEDVYVPGAQPSLDDTTNTSGIITGQAAPAEPVTTAPAEPVTAAPAEPTATGAASGAGDVPPSTGVPTEPGANGSTGTPAADAAAVPAATGTGVTAPTSGAAVPVNDPVTYGTVGYRPAGYRPLGPTAETAPAGTTTSATTNANSSGTGKASENLK
jgi:hypothetical protein